MLNRIIHPSPDQVRWTGLAAMVGGALGLVFAPLYSLAYFATGDGAADANSALIQAWAEPARDLLDPLLTFASPDVVRVTYFKLFLFIAMGMLAGVVGLHASQAEQGGRLERWGFRVSVVGLLLLTSARSAATGRRCSTSPSSRSSCPDCFCSWSAPRSSAWGHGGPASRPASAPCS